MYHCRALTNGIHSRGRGLMKRNRTNPAMQSRTFYNEQEAMQSDNTVKIIEVGARDGLQNEKTQIPTETKIQLIERLADAGLSNIEATSFVSPKWVPQLADGREVMSKLNRKENVTYYCLVPNLKGLQAAIDAKATHVATGASPSEGFSKKNANCTVKEGMLRCREIVGAASSIGLPTTGYISTVIGCPYDGKIKPKTVAKMGIRAVDSSVAGLGGCPYAPGATGNLATEDIVYMLHGSGMKTGVDLDALVLTGKWICEAIGRTNSSRTGSAIIAKCSR